MKNGFELNFSIDYYWILGLSADTATQSDIKSNFRKLAKKWHPDRNGNSEESSRMFKTICEAYEVLSDPERKAIYDERRSCGGESMLKSPFMEIFRAKKKDPREKSDGDDIYVSADVTFDESMRGNKEKRISIKRQSDCPKCGGYGSLSRESGISPCISCNGTGKLEYGLKCGNCNGTGYEVSNKCDMCGGLGRIIIEETLSVEIPKGVNTGSMLRVAGMGNRGHLGGSDGDAYIEVNLAENKDYHRQGQNLFAKIKIPFDVFILGGEVDIPLPMGGTEKREIPPLRNGKYSLVVNGRGVPYVGMNKTGNLIVSFEAEFPTSITDAERGFIEQYANERKRRTASDETGGEPGEEEADTVQGHSSQ